MTLPAILNAPQKSAAPALAAIEASLLDGLCLELNPVAAARRVEEVRIGLGYTAVRLDNGRCGVAYTFRHNTGHGCCAVRDAGSLAPRPAAELMRNVYSADPIIAAIGLATLNALAPKSDAPEADALELARVDRDDTVGMIGRFSPLVEPLQQMAHELLIFDDDSNLADIHPREEQPKLLPRCQVVFITATTLINHTLGQLLELCRKAREVVLLGPSTPFVPALFAARGVTILSGVEVTDPARLLQVVSEGGGTRQFASSVRKLSLRIR